MNKNKIKEKDIVIYRCDVCANIECTVKTINKKAPPRCPYNFFVQESNYKKID